MIRKRRDQAGETAANEPDGKESPEQKLLKVAGRLDYMIGQITPDEFAWQDANYDRDSVLGRELLFLIANDGWIRATSEIIDIARSDAIETSIEIDVDLSLITHEAFRDQAGQIWLPIAVLPPLQQRLPDDAEPFSTLTVTAADSSPLMTLPRADIRHRVAAALTEIIVNVAVARLPDISNRKLTPGRDQRLVLSAAIYRLLRDEVVPPNPAGEAIAVDEMPGEATGRIGPAQRAIRDMLTEFAGLLRQKISSNDANRINARQLTERALRVLDAMTESAIIVVPAELNQPPTVLTVTLPGRALHSAPTKWEDLFGPSARPNREGGRSAGWRWHLRPSNWIFPSASLHLDLLLSSPNSDRHVRVNLPEGISPDPSRLLARRADLDVRCEQPQSIRQLAAVTGQLLDADRKWPVPLQQSLADLALAKASAVEATLRDLHAGAGDGERQLAADQARQITRDFRQKLHNLSSALGQTAKLGCRDSARDALTQAQGDGKWLDRPMQRRTSRDTISPGVVAARVRAIDDVTQRAATTTARMEVRIAVTDSAYYNAARLSGWINLLLMSVVLLFFVFGHLSAAFRLTERQVSPEVLALVLTLFSAIQLGRIERNDRSAMRGVLVPAGNPLIIVAILPPVVLAIAVAFTQSFPWTWSWTAGCIAVQAAAQFAAWYWQRTLLERGRPAHEPDPGSMPDDPRAESDLLFYTDEPDYTHDLVLHSNWWRTTTAEALMMGRAAYGYVIWQHDDQQTLDSLLGNARPAREPLDRAANVLALQRSGTFGQTLNFAVFREEPDAHSDWASEHAKKVGLHPIMLTLGVDTTFDVYLGLSSDLYAMVGDHPVTAVLNLATKYGLATCDTRLPVPAPEVYYADLEWCRIELSARPEDLSHIPLFLTDLLKQSDRAVIGVRTRRDGMPRMLSERPATGSTKASAAAGSARMARATDLDIVSRSAVSQENPDTANWRVMAICADWRIGIEGRSLAALDPDLALIGLTTTVLYGQSVLLLLCHARTGVASHDDEAIEDFIRFDRWQSRAELGTALSHPLLRVHLRTPDRPGATIGVLDSLREAICHEQPKALSRGDISVWYARVEVKDGNTANVQFTVMLPIPAVDDPHPAEQWTDGDLWQIERRALALLASRMANGDHSLASPISSAEIPPGTTIQLGLIKMPDLAHPPAVSGSRPEPTAAPESRLAAEGGSRV